jgi:hypothetical protein
MPELKKEGFGYQVLPFEHEKDGEIDVGLRALSIPTWYGSPSTNLKLIPSVQSRPVDGFAKLIERLNRCYEVEVERMTKGRGFVCIVFCRECRQLSLRPMKEAHLCSLCGEDLRLK